MNEVLMKGGPLDGRIFVLPEGISELSFPPQSGIATETTYAFSGRHTEDGTPIWEVQK